MLPGIFFYLRTAKNFKMTVPFMYSFRSFDFLKLNFSHFTQQVRLCFLEKKETYNFRIEKCDGERNQKKNHCCNTD